MHIRLVDQTLWCQSRSGKILKLQPAGHLLHQAVSSADSSGGSFQVSEMLCLALVLLHPDILNASNGCCSLRGDCRNNTCVCGMLERNFAEKKIGRAFQTNAKGMSKV